MTELAIGTEEMPKIGIYLEDGAKFPERQTHLSAGYDIASNKDVTIAPGETTLVGTGVYIESISDLAMFLFARSSLALKKNLILANGVGLIDADYRGEIKVMLHNVGSETVEISKGERIAQLVFFPWNFTIYGRSIDASMELLDEKPEPVGNRTGGYGSTG